MIIVISAVATIAYKINPTPIREIAHALLQKMAPLFYN